MEIINKIGRKYFFKQLNIGDIFVVNGGYYIKIQTIYSKLDDSYFPKNAMSLKTMHFYRFEDNYKIEEFISSNNNTKLVIE